MKTKIRFLLLLLAAMVLTQTATAAEVIVGDLKYETEDTYTTASVSGYVNTLSGDITIESTVEDNGTTYKVTKIADGADKESGVFYDCTEITSVAVSENLTYIGKYAFYGCNGMTSIDLKDKLTNINVNAFLGCRKLESIEFPSTLVTINNYAFNNCSALTTVDIPASVTTLGNYSFKGCSALATVYFNWTESDKILTAGTEVFTNISSPATIYVPEGCVDLYTTAGWSVFGTITEVATDTDDPDDPAEPTTPTLTYNITDTDAKTAEVTGYDADGVTPAGELVIPATVEIEGVTYNVTSIASGSGTDAPFLNCTGITSINLPEGLTSIGTYAFRGCSGFTSLEIPSSVTTIGNYAFAYCTKLASIDLPDGLKTIGQLAFRNCALKSIKIPSSVTSIGNSAFISCASLASVTVYWYQASDIATLGTTAFDSISESAILYVPEDCTSLYTTTWSDYFSSTVEFEITIPDNLTYDLDNTTYTATVTGYNTAPEGELVIPATVSDEDGNEYTVTSINNGATKATEGLFYSCTGITSVVLPESLTTIGAYAFQGCTSLESIIIPCVKYIYANAFMNCKNLASIVLPSTLIQIGSYGFGNSTSLTSIDIPSSVTTIGNNAFNGCTDISEVYVHWLETPTSINQGIFSSLYDESTGKFNATLYIPTGTTSIYESADWWKLFTSIVEAKVASVTTDDETLTLSAGDVYYSLTIVDDGVDGGEVYAEGLDITVKSLEVIKTFDYGTETDNKAKWFSLGLPFEVEAGTGCILKLDNGVYVEAVQGEDYATYDYNGANRLAYSDNGGNWDMYVDDLGEIGEVIQFSAAGEHTYKFIAADQTTATTALTTGREGNRFYDTSDTSDDNGWNVIPAGKTYTGNYTIDDVVIMSKLLSDGTFDSNDATEFTPGEVFAVQLNSSDASTSVSVTTSDDESAEVIVEKYKFELADADGEVLDRIFIFDGSDKQQYRVGKMRALSADKTEMSIQANDKSYCAYSTLASETDKSYTVAISNATEGAELVMVTAGTQSVAIDNATIVLDSPISVEDGQITITIGSQTSSVTDAIATTKVYAANGAIVIEGAGAYVVTNMSGMTVASGVADGYTVADVTAGIYIVKVNNIATKVIVK